MNAASAMAEPVSWISRGIRDFLKPLFLSGNDAPPHPGAVLSRAARWRAYHRWDQLPFSWIGRRDGALVGNGVDHRGQRVHGGIACAAAFPRRINHRQDVVMAAFVLVHSPATGPSTWRWVADELTARGHRVSVPAVP